ncbi:MAG: chromosome segregation SMC family protein [Nanoarchaeota archaeon]|nr:chromosome segregation SMC family protein [Nanoarchaeota archaeon]
MVFIKKLVMHGFKSFARKTEIIFDRGINVIIGPNGSGKSNVSDALCFVLGRLSIKSIRAAKSKNLLFMGSKYIKPAREASVELVFDNTDRAFSIDQDEVTIKRAVKYNGQSVYKINDELKTRIEIIEMLAQAGIDPHGFNLILQGQIQAVVKMHPEERRKIIEEVAGISIYELRKEKSLHELEKTEEKLKEVSAILRERTVYMRNLDKERSQALRFKELESSVKRIKGSIVHKKLEDKQRELESIEKSIATKTEQKDKIKAGWEKAKQMIEEISEKINQINKDIQQSTGIEQETLHNQIANLKAEIEGLKVRKENYEHRKAEIERRIEEMSRSIPDIESEVKGLKEKSPLMAKKAQELKKKKDELAQIEEERKRVLTFKSELSSLHERIKDRERQITHNSVESESVLKQLEEYSRNLVYHNEEECNNKLKELKDHLARKRDEIDSLHQSELENERAISVSESEIDRHGKTVSDVQKIDICPLCQSKITQEHISHVLKDASEKTKISRTKLFEAQQQLEEIKSNREKIWKEIQEIGDKISKGDIELIKHRNIKEKKEHLKRIVEREQALKDEIKNLQEKTKNLENKTFDFSKIDENYNSKILEIEEISSRTEEDVDTTLLYKERELEKIRNIITRSSLDIKDLESYIKDLSGNLHRKIGELENKEDLERKLNEKFKKMFERRDGLQKEIQEKSVESSDIQNNVRQIEDQINYLKIGKAKIDAERESLDMEMSDYSGVEYIQASINALEERLVKTQEALREIGSINMRALEIYDEIKKEYDEVQEKVNTIEKERQEILKIIDEIDAKKRRSFMKAFKGINELFTRNFAQLYNKGIAFLELENKEDIFAGGVNIVVRLAKGKYFDVTSLSGGEQTLVALSLLFAIQEYKPYHFYIFDEIDAALDKRNSERLAALLGQYMKSGQYIVITHNDAIIMNSNILYGVSMHEGVSKVLSLKMDEPLPPEIIAREENSSPLEENNAKEEILDEAPLAAETLEEPKENE